MTLTDDHTIRDVEILRTGTWDAQTGRTSVSLQDLDDMFTAFSTINQIGGYKPVLKLGHAETQKFWGQKEGAPNLGFVRNLRRVGESIVADFENVYPPLFDAIKAGRYTQVSVEFFRKALYAGREFKNALTAVAILGAELPAVKGLSDLTANSAGMEGLELVTLTFRQEDPIMPEGKTYTEAEHKQALDTAVAAARGEEAQKFGAEKATLTAQVTALTARAEAAEGALQKFTADARDKEVVAIVDAAVAAGKWLPKDREVLLAQGRAQATIVKFGADGKDGLEMFKAFAEALPKVVALDTETGAATTEQPAGQGKVKAAQTISEMQTKLIADGKAKDMGEAYRIALAEAPTELKQRYLKGE